MGDGLPLQIDIFSVGILSTDPIKELGIIVQAPRESEGEVNSIATFGVSEAKRALDTAFVFEEVEALGGQTSPLTLARDDSVHGH